MDDQHFMQRACDLALKGQGKTSPNPMVGAVIVKNNRIIAEGWHRRCGGPHAEVLALRKAGQQAQGATLYVTLEPCHHYGRTPPCVDAVIKSKVKAVVIAMRDPNSLTNGKSIRKLRAQGIKVRTGILEKTAQQLNQGFVKYITTRMPFVTAKIAQTIDGKIATANGQSKWITSLATRAFTRKLRNDFDAILVGVDTVLADDPCLCPASKTKHLRKIVVDSLLRTPVNAKLFALNPQDCIIATTDRARQAKRLALEKKGARVLVCPGKQGRVDLKWLFEELARQGIVQLLIEGGPTVIGAALQDKLIDRFHIFIAPKIIGDQHALSSVQGLKTLSIEQSLELKDLTVQRIGLDLMVEGYPKYF